MFLNLDRKTFVFLNKSLGSLNKEVKMNALKKVNKMEKKMKTETLKKKTAISKPKKITKKPTMKSAVVKIKPAKSKKQMNKTSTNVLGSIVMHPKLETAEHWRREKLKEGVETKLKR